MTWPKHPDFENPITSILAKDRSHRFNFALFEGETTALIAGIVLKENKFAPALVKTAILWWQKGTGNLVGMTLLDRQGEAMVRVGEEKHERYEIEIKENERIVGVSSFTAGAAFHYDV